MTEPASISGEPWEELEAILSSGNAQALAGFLQLLAPEDTAYTISHLSEDNQTRLLSLLSSQQPEFAADLMEHFADEHAADMIQELEPRLAAAIVDQMDSDEQADVLAELEDDQAEAILSRMDPEEARDARDRLQYAQDTAGGLMITEILKYHADQNIEDIIRDLQEHGQEYDEYETRYVYITSEADRLEGVMPMRRVPLVPRGRSVTQAMIREPITVGVETDLDELEHLFDRVDFSAVPVIGAGGEICGVVQRAAVQEALTERSTEDFLKFGGIIGGEELRSMPFKSRWLRRLSFLAPGIILSSLSVSIIGFYQPIIHRLTVLAVFLPLVANLSGAAGNQAVAVSIRELALGLVMPRDAWRVLRKEVFVGLCNGLIIGAVLFLIVVVTQNHQYTLAAVIGTAYALNSIFAVSIGGTIPLMLKAIKVDPAMVSSPVMATLTDMGSFFLTLTFATLMLSVTGS